MSDVGYHTKEAFAIALTVDMALGCSTNTMLTFRPSPEPVSPWDIFHGQRDQREGPEFCHLLLPVNNHIEISMKPRSAGRDA